MDTIGGMIAARYGELPASSRKKIRDGTIMWLLNADDEESGEEYSRTHLGALIKKECGAGANTREYVKDLTYSEQSGYLLGNLKPWVWWGIRNGLGPWETVDIAHEFGILDIDKFLASATSPRSRVAASCKALADKYGAMRPEEIKDRLGRALASLGESRYIEKFCRRKLTFVVQGSGKWTMGDMVADLTAKAIRDVLTQYPKIDDDLHFVNIMKRSVHNRGINHIHHATGPASEGIRAVGDWRNGVFEARTIGLGDAVLQEMSYEDDYLPKAAAFIGRHSGSKRELLSILAGYPNEEFSKWLGEDNAAYYEENMICGTRRQKEEFLSKLAGFADMDMEEMADMVKGVAAELGHGGEAA